MSESPLNAPPSTARLGKWAVDYGRAGGMGIGAKAEALALEKNDIRSYLPREILDDIVNLLHYEPWALKQCCIVSKPWVPSTRKHLFATIDFTSIQDIESWKGTFGVPDPKNSPAYYTRTLFLRRAVVVTAAGAGADWLIQAFLHVVRLDFTASDAESTTISTGHRPSFP